MFRTILCLIFLNVALCKDCYWNAKCPYNLYSTVTPYDSVRGDLRDVKLPDCQPDSVWSLHRHGNRNPSPEVTVAINDLQQKIINAIKNDLELNRTQSINCYQDIEDLLNWSWNTTIENTPNYLTGFGYEEVYGIGKRIGQKFKSLLSGTADKFYFRPTSEQRTVTSTIAFVHGLTHGMSVNLTGSIDGPWEIDNVIRPYDNCAMYRDEVKKGQALIDELAAYDSSPEMLAVRDRAQKHLGTSYKLSVADTFNLYELCRFNRSWSPNLRSPWCFFFTNEDLEVLEYRDDVRHYYRNGYGAEINVKLGSAPLKDLYEKFEDAAMNRGRSIVSYFTHDTMTEMVFSALGLYKDLGPIKGSTRKPNRLWRTSKMSAFSTNLIAVLFKCQEGGRDEHRVQFLINEELTTLCPEEGCKWTKFAERFQTFSNSSSEKFCFNKKADIELGSNRGIKYLLTGVLMILPVFLII